MEPIASVLDAIKGLVQSGEQLVKGAFQSRSDGHSRNPIDILKRLQREAFSDLMKLRDRQDKVEHMLSSFISSKGSPFQETSTHLKGILNVGGVLVCQDDREAYNALDSSGINTGINAKFIFKTNLRQKDALLAELVAHQNDMRYGNEFTGNPLVLSKVMYLASVSDLLSVISIPFGATCNDFQFNSDHFQGECITGLSLSRPSLFNLYHACAIGLSVKTSKFSASFAELVSGRSTNIESASRTNNLSTFALISTEPFGETKLTLSGVWKMPCSFSNPTRLGKFGSHSRPDKRELTSSSLSGRQSTESKGAICMLLDIDESSKFGGWLEVQKSSPSLLNWAVSLSDMPESEIGWGITVGGSTRGQSSSVVLESFLNFSVGKRAILQPGLVFMFNEGGRTPGLVFRSSWSM
ncbi:hypothetical protein Cni_G22191 [Canna indica]|uniref:Uncharacterized protein n=1 Tax=Canna indica TaxID=4628 RepID=A0AAQ3KWB4_9LILI|nr:hypothetical protein Cni_G22191 [Canna indica]